jgi:glucan biosynthesis protein
MEKVGKHGNARHNQLVWGIDRHCPDDDEGCDDVTRKTCPFPDKEWQFDATLVWYESPPHMSDVAKVDETSSGVTYVGTTHVARPTQHADT